MSKEKFDAFVEHKGYYNIFNNNEGKVFKTNEGLTLSEQQEFNQNEKDIAETTNSNL